MITSYWTLVIYLIHIYVNLSKQQAQLQSHTMTAQSQPPQQQMHITQQHPPPKPPTPTIHSTNPEINALATGLMNSANQFQQQVAGKCLLVSQTIKPM